MKWLVVTDIHGNLPALEAVLAAPEAKACERILSLGDHTNFGPCPREVHERLCALDAVMLMGNHEERQHHLNDPEFANYSWRLLHWTAEQLKGLRMPEMVDFRIGPVWCTHAVPGNVYKLVDGEGIISELDNLPEDVTLLLTGHNHIFWDVSSGGRRAVNPGSLGIHEEPPGSLAPFAVLDTDNWSVQRYAVPYDVTEVIRAYVESGCVWEAPEMTRAVLEPIRYGRFHYVLQLIRFINQTAEELGMSPQSCEAWREADRRWPWREAMDSISFWKSMEEKIKLHQPL